MACASPPGEAATVKGSRCRSRPDNCRRWSEPGRCGALSPGFLLFFSYHWAWSIVFVTGDFVSEGSLGIVSPFGRSIVLGRGIVSLFDCGPASPRERTLWALSVSLAATQEVEVSFLSWGYLDVSVHPVHSLALCIQARVTSFSRSGFPIQKSPDQSLLSNSPELIAAMPRLSSLLDAKTSTVYPL